MVPPQPVQPQPHRVVVLALDGAYPFELGIPARVLGAADDRYEVVVCSCDGGPVETNAGFSVVPQHGPEALASADTVIIAPLEKARLTRELPAAVADALARIRPGTRIASICSGGFILAAAGLLDGRVATNHWESAELFRRWYPHIRLDEGVLFVDDGDVLTSAGAASGVDLCLHLIRNDHGSHLANHAARRCVVAPFRDGGQAQYIERPIPDDPAASTSATRQWALERLGDKLTVEQMAERSHMSVRTFVRRFRAETGLPPGQWLIKQRLARARNLLESTDLTVDQVAFEIGFATAASLRQHLHAELGVSPLAYRRTFRAADSTAGMAL
ncbi:GlxA family transcriptional regulator [Streptomyces sp. AM8-1-1]|uniref:GlxA family transcriptional regulator n=1 Tax=Streptomyces sp. AM8-1-1 TaxID=3075825 RepID=UPI0028C3FC44|nr:helix-turn-helix domain-containing protein [Streptomyces sp. AM8-1-1]WNO73264.1 helix-turn-helix domain-containing protein [Streptomyces sp. AM8-1-1]